jgi:hypothetical protein
MTDVPAAMTDASATEEREEMEVRKHNLAVLVEVFSLSDDWGKQGELQHRGVGNGNFADKNRAEEPRSADQLKHSALSDGDDVCALLETAALRQKTFQELRGNRWNICMSHW